VKEKSYTKGVSGVTLGGNEMKSGLMEDDAPIGQAKKWKMAWKQVFYMVNGFQTFEDLQQMIVHARDKRKTSIQAQYSNGQATEACCHLLTHITSIKNHQIYKQ
jgi:hypothetical protein